MIKINIKLWYKDGSGKEEDKRIVVAYVPDRILYKNQWWEKESSCIDLDSDFFTKVHYKQVIAQ